MAATSRDSHIDKLRATYHQKLNAMDDTLHHYFDGLAMEARLDGGYFFLVQFEESVDTNPLRNRPRDLEAGFQYSASFST